MDEKVTDGVFTDITISYCIKLLHFYRYFLKFIQSCHYQQKQ